MTQLREHLEGWVENGDPLGWTVWDEGLRALVDTAEVGGDHLQTTSLCWVLTGWSEVAASRAVQTVDKALVASALAALIVADRSGRVDRRDLLTVAQLLRRAVALCSFDIDEVSATTSSLPSVGKNEEPVLDWFRQAEGIPTSTHREIAEGLDFRFERAQGGVDVDKLLRWANGEP